MNSWNRFKRESTPRGTLGRSRTLKMNQLYPRSPSIPVGPEGPRRLRGPESAFRHEKSARKAAAETFSA